MGQSADLNSDNLQLIRQSARDFAETYIRPHVMEWDEIQHFPIDLFHHMGELGFLGVLVPENTTARDWATRNTSPLLKKFPKCAAPSD